MKFSIPLLLLIGIVLSSHLTVSRAQTDVKPAQIDEQLALKIEALKRLKGLDLSTNPSLKSAVLNVVNKTRGTHHFVELVKQFKLPDQEQELLNFSVQHPKEDVGVEALRMVIASGKTALIQSALHSKTPTVALNTATALGNAKSKATPDLLTPLISTTNAPLDVRKQSILSLVQTPEGARSVLKLAEASSLPADLKFTATSELNRVRWADVKEKAAELLPLPQGPDAKPLPSLAKLVKMQGDSENGKKVYQTATASCAACHKAGEIGTDVGPNLTLIGAKLGKDALFEAILEPSAGISFGFEAWSFELKDGEEAYGLIASETNEEVAIKNTTGIITTYKKSEIESRAQAKLSLMPPGLQQAMTVQELVDLVTFLTTLK